MGSSLDYVKTTPKTSGHKFMIEVWGPQNAFWGRFTAWQPVLDAMMAGGADHALDQPFKVTAFHDRHISAWIIQVIYR